MSRTPDLVNELQRLGCGLREVKVGALNEEGLRAVTAEVRGLERVLASVKLRIGQRANELAAAGRGADAGSVLLGTGSVSGGTARKEAARAEVVEAMPLMASALADGRLGGEHLDAIARTSSQLDVQTSEALTLVQDDLVDAAARMPVDTFSRHLRREVDRIRNDHGLERALRMRAKSELRRWTDKDGMGHLHTTLDPEWFAIVDGAIERQLVASANASDTPVQKNPELAAHALVELISHGNGRAGRAHIDLVVDVDTALHGPHERSIRQTIDGVDLPPETLDRFCCDAVIRKVVLDRRGVPIDLGRSARTATDAQWSALKAIYSHCGWADCERPVSWCQAHHIKEWGAGGPTDLNNLVPLCSRHHHAVHEGKWSVRLLPNRTMRIYRPDKQHWADAHPDRIEDWPAAKHKTDPQRPLEPPGQRRRTHHNS